MKKHCCSLLVVLLSCLLASCGDDDYRYPSVKQDFLTAFSGTDGRLESVLTDEGERLRIVEGASGLRVSADTAVRIGCQLRDIGNRGRRCCGRKAVCFAANGFSRATGCRGV